jgi:hypothetical protein
MRTDVAEWAVARRLASVREEPFGQLARSVLGERVPIIALEAELRYTELSPVAMAVSKAKTARVERDHQ